MDKTKDEVQHFLKIAGGKADIKSVGFISNLINRMKFTVAAGSPARDPALQYARRTQGPLRETLLRRKLNMAATYRRGTGTRPQASAAY